MKKILIALVMTGFAYCGAEAQTIQVACERSQNKVCRMSKNGVSCYQTKYAENFPVCKGDYGYFICCETPNNTNSTIPEIVEIGLIPYRSQNTTYAYVMHSMTRDEEQNSSNNAVNEMIAPQSQSYPEYSANAATTWDGYYPKHYIKACSNSDNVAEENRAAYNGCPTPAYDGPAKNMYRNMNVSNPNENYPLAPITGNRR